MATPDVIRDLLEPLLAAEGFELVDAQVGPALVRVLVDRLPAERAEPTSPGPGGIDLDGVARATELVSTALDEADPMPGRYTLEVSSPGIERPLRTPDHFLRHVGSTVSVKTVASFAGERRFEGELTAAGDDGIEVTTPDGDTVAVAYPEIDRARTVFQWDAAPKRGTTGRQKKPAQKAGTQKKPTRGRQTEKAS